MSAPRYVPHTLEDLPRRALSLPPAARWKADRPGDLKGSQPEGSGLGDQGPDQGYALRLLHLFDDRVVLAPGERRDDVDAGIIEIALKRASQFGRAPVVHDLDLAYRLFGFLADAPADVVEHRRARFAGAAHSYDRRRAIADSVSADTLRVAPDQVVATAAHR